MGLLRLIAIFVLIYLAFRLFITLVLPWVARWYLNRFKKKFYEQNPHLRQDDEPKRKNKTRIWFNNRKTRQYSQSMDDVGEYVDYEELDDDNDKNGENNK